MKPTAGSWKCWSAGLVALLAFGLTLSAMTVKDSSEFETRFDGNEIWNGSYQNGWSDDGAAETLSGTVLNRVNQSNDSLIGINSTTNGGTTTWNTGNHLDWTVEMRVRFNAIPNGTSWWLGNDTDRIIFEIYDTHTQDTGAGTFNTTHGSNVDGQFHVYRCAHDSVANRYHVWRDGIRLTPPGGVGYDSGTNDNRMLFGDYTSGGFGNGYNMDIAYVRYDQTGAYLPPTVSRHAAHFNVGFKGSEIWNGTAYTNGWTFSSNPALTLNADNTLTFVNDNQDWIEGTPSSVDDGATTWDTYNHLDWTLEIRMKFNALPNGMAFWLCTGAERAVVDVFDTYTEDSGGNTFTVSHAANTDGEYHTYRIASDSVANRYHVWRDGVLLTPVGGVTYDSTGGDNRLIIGDRTSQVFGNNFDVTIAYVRYDHSAVYLPRDTMFQYGFDYTSALVTDQNMGVIEDDSGAFSGAKKHYNNPTYAADIPPAARTKNCTGIGSVDLSTGHHSVQTCTKNIITREDLVAAGGLTMEVWAKQTATAGGSALIMSMQDAFTISSPANKYRVVINSFGNSSPEFAFSDSLKVSTGWMHLAAVIRDYAEGATTNGTVELWVNGYLEDSITIDYAPSINLGRGVELGAAWNSGSGNYRWDGFVYEPRVTLGALDGGDFLWQPPDGGTIFTLR